MKKIILLALFTGFVSLVSHAQLSMVKMLGKEGEKSKLGYSFFCNAGFPVNEVGNRQVVIEFLDFSLFPPKDESLNNSIIGNLSIKAGFRNVFNSEGSTGFFIEPQAGYCVVVRDAIGKATKKSGFAAAMVGGYNIGVGQRGSAISIGIKYEADMAGTDYSIQTLGFRLQYAFNMFAGSRD